MGKIDVNKFHRKTKANCSAKRTLSSTIPDSNWNWRVYWQAKKLKIKKEREQRTKAGKWGFCTCLLESYQYRVLDEKLFNGHKQGGPLFPPLILNYNSKKNTAWWGPGKEAMRGSEKGWTNYKEMHKRVHQVALWDKRWTELGGKHTCKNLHKIFPHDPAELMHDVFQETHLKWKGKHNLSHALV